MNALRIRPARPDELGEVVGLWSEASRWLASQGRDQWQYPPRRWRMEAAVQDRECYLAFCGGTLAGMITVGAQADLEWWADDDPSSALYVHDLTVRRAFSGRALGARLLDRAGVMAAEADKPWLRLEAWKTNHDLHRYYLDQGFDLLRIVDLPHRNSGALFQRPTGARRCGSATPGGGADGPARGPAPRW